MTSRLFVPAGLALALCSAAAWSAPMFGDQRPMSNYDSNGDGTVTMDEVQASRTAEFAAIDSNGDGYAGLAEFIAWGETQQAAQFNTLDTDQNGALSETEFVGSKTGRHATMASEIFKLADSDGSASLSPAEFQVLDPVSARAIQGFAHMDTDNDLKVSKTEYLTVPAGRGHGGGAGGPGGGRGGPGG